MAAEKPVEKIEKPATKTHRWIQCNRDGGLGIQLRGKFEEISKTLSPGPRLDLVPGWNIVEGAKWEQAKKESEHVRILLAERIGKSKAPEQNQERVGHCYLVEGDECDPRDPLRDVAEREAIPMVEQILDHRLIGTMVKLEKRSPVSVALADQFAVLTQTVKQKSA